MSDVVSPPPGRLAALSKSLRGSPMALVALAVLLAFVLMAAVGAPLAEPHIGKLDFAARALPPFGLDHGWAYIFGSDNLGRSLLARVVYASRNTLLIATASVFASFVIGTALGIWAGYAGGWVSTVIMRLCDAILSFPVLLLAILLLYILQAQNQTLVIVLAFSRLPIFLRAARAETLDLRERLFVTAARVAGLGPLRIVFWHILPNALPTLLTLGALELGFVMISESSLSFIGLGVQPPELSLGLLVSQGSEHLNALWWLAAIPGSIIVFVSLALNILAGWLRLHLDPTQRWRVDA